MSNDIIVLEEILGYVLEALDVIEVHNFFALGKVQCSFSCTRYSIAVEALLVLQ